MYSSNSNSNYNKITEILKFQTRFLTIEFIYIYLLTKLYKYIKL